MLKIFMVAAAALTLSGCVSAKERALDQLIAARQAAYQAQLQETDDNSRCVSFGAQPGSAAYTQCRMQLTQMRMSAEQAEQDRRAAAAAQAQAAWAQHQQDFYDQQMANIRAAGQFYHPVTPTAPTNCITNYVSGSAYTNCN